MAATRVFWKRLALVYIVIVFLVFGTVRSAKAQGIVYGDTLPSGQVIENDAILYGNTVVIDGEIDGDVLAIGTLVKVNGTVKGSLIAIGETVLLNGQIDGTLYGAGNTFELDESAIVGRNAYYGGLTLIVQPGAQIGRDLVAASLLGAKLSGEIGRDVNAIIGPSEFIRLIIESLGGEIQLPWITQSANPNSTSRYFQKRGSSLPMSGAGILVLNTASKLISENDNRIPMTSVEKSNIILDESVTEGIDNELLEQWIIARLQEFVILLVYGFIGLWLFTPSLKRSVKALREKPLPSVGYGLLGLVIAVNIFLVITLLAALIFVIGLWLGFANLWELGFAVWALGFFSLGLVTLLFDLFVIFGSKIIVVYFTGTLILGLISEKAKNYRMLALILGLLLYVLIVSISLVGWVIAVLVTALGLGAFVVAYLDMRRRSNVESLS